jgi:hypothetical protein
MSIQFYEKVLSLFSAVITFLVVVAASALVLLAYLFERNIVFYYAWLSILIFSLISGVKLILNLRDFKTTLPLLIPNSEEEKPSEPLNIKSDNQPLQSCLFYEQGSTFPQIVESMGLQHPTQAQRLVRKGLKILLKSYSEHEKKVET